MIHQKFRKLYRHSKANAWKILCVIPAVIAAFCLIYVTENAGILLSIISNGN